MAPDPTLRDLAVLPERHVVLSDGEGDWTAGQLRAATGGVARHLVRRGVRPGDRVGVGLRRGGAAVAALLGARAAGAVCVPFSGRPPTGLAVALGDDLPRLEAPLAPVEGGPHAWAVPTSGTTGAPRLVALTSVGVEHVTGAVQGAVPYRPDDRVLCSLPLHHTYGLSQLWLALRSGARLLLPPSPLLPADAVAWAERATVLPAVSYAVRTLLAVGARPRLRLVTLAGQATLPHERVAFAEALPDTAFAVYYGLTEATTRVLWLPPDDFLRHPTATGRPIEGVAVGLDDGELWVEGPNVADGYLDDPLATARRFAGGRLRTGDLFEQRGGLFHFAGRTDGCFKWRGEKVVPERIEAVLCAMPEVADCRVTLEDGPLADHLVALCVPAGEPVAPGVILARLRGADLPLCPTRIRWVDSLQRGTTGKLQRR